MIVYVRINVQQPFFRMLANILNTIFTSYRVPQITKDLPKNGAPQSERISEAPSEVPFTKAFYFKGKIY